jgi:sRNA-binding carbon storage regulator CsrA
MLSLTIEKGEWVTIGNARVKLDRNCQIVVDAPREVVVVRGSLAKNRLKREVLEIQSNAETPFPERAAVAFLCKMFGLHSQASELGFQEWPDSTNPMITVVAERLKLPKTGAA